MCHYRSPTCCGAVHRADQGYRCSACVHWLDAILCPRCYLLWTASRYRTSIAEDEAIIVDETLPPRQRVASRLLRIEKGILEGACMPAPLLASFSYLITRCRLSSVRCMSARSGAQKVWGVCCSAGALRQVREHPDAEVPATRFSSAWPATVKLA
jgi:hypothetical protein